MYKYDCHKRSLRKHLYKHSIFESSKVKTTELNAVKRDPYGIFGSVSCDKHLLTTGHNFGANPAVPSAFRERK